MWPTFFIPASGGLSLEGYADLGCASSAVFEPANDIAGLRAGDLMVWQFNVRPGSWDGSNNCMTIPSGWTPFCTPKYKANFEWEYSYAVLYRWATSDDLSPSTSYTVTFPRTNGFACSRVTTHRDAHSECPFGSMVYDGFNGPFDASRFLPSPYPADDETVHIIWAMLFKASLGLMPAVPTLTIPVGPDEAMRNYYDSAIVWSGSFDSAYRMGVGVVTAYDDENWIPNENSSSCLAASGWTGSGVGTISRGGTGSQYAVFSGSGAGSIRHYWEYEVTLEAGEKYTFFFGKQRNNWNYGNGDMSMGISYVDPDGVERGAIATDGSLSFLDPSADRETVWHGELLHGGASGVPSIHSGIVALFFTAGAAGTYKLRVNGIEGNTTNWAFVTSGSEQWKVVGVNFRKGWRTPYFVQTGDSPVYSGSGPVEKMGSPIGWLSVSNTNSSGGGGRIFRCFSVVSASKSDFSGVSPRGAYYTWAPMAGLRQYGYHDRLAYGTLGGSSSYGFTGILAPRTLVYPTYGGVRRKYYVELTALDSGTGYRLCFHTPTADAWTPGRNIMLSADDAVAYSVTEASTAVDGSVTVGDKIGAMVDFTTTGQVTVTFYKDGVSLYSSTVTTGAATQWPDDEPWQFALFSRGSPWPSPSTRFSVNTTGPFSYKPSGALAWAAVNDAS